MSECHGEGYRCGHCGKHFARRKHLNSHIARVRKTARKKTECIFFEHSMTLNHGEDDDEDVSNSMDSEEDGIEGDMEESKESALIEIEDDDEDTRWKSELLEIARKRQKTGELQGQELLITKTTSTNLALGEKQSLTTN
jgi:hypothetical protein